MYKAHVLNDLEFINELIKILYHFSIKYGNLLKTDDLNMNIENVHLSTPLKLSTCIADILPNQELLFKIFKTSETGLSDHHKLMKFKSNETR